MTDSDSDFLPLRVIRTCADGKQRYDADGKRKLIDACRRPGASQAGLARRAGVNANQLRKWVWRHEWDIAAAKARANGPTPPAFMPVVAIDDSAQVLVRAQEVRPVSEPTLQPATSRPSSRSTYRRACRRNYPTAWWWSFNARGETRRL
ncbi:transposase [Paraburkholderia graminis]